MLALPAEARAAMAGSLPWQPRRCRGRFRRGMERWDRAPDSGTGFR